MCLEVRGSVVVLDKHQVAVRPGAQVDAWTCCEASRNKVEVVQWRYDLQRRRDQDRIVIIRPLPATTLCLTPISLPPSSGRKGGGAGLDHGGDGGPL